VRPHTSICLLTPAYMYLVQPTVMLRFLRIDSGQYSMFDVSTFIISHIVVCGHIYSGIRTHMVVIGEPLVWKSFFLVLKLSNNCKRPPLPTNITNICVSQGGLGWNFSHPPGSLHQDQQLPDILLLGWYSKSASICCTGLRK